MAWVLGSVESREMSSRSPRGGLRQHLKCLLSSFLKRLVSSCEVDDGKGKMGNKDQMVR